MSGITPPELGQALEGPLVPEDPAQPQTSAEENDADAEGADAEDQDADAEAADVGDMNGVRDEFDPLAGHDSGSARPD